MRWVKIKAEDAIVVVYSFEGNTVKLMSFGY